MLVTLTRWYFRSARRSNGRSTVQKAGWFLARFHPRTDGYVVNNHDVVNKPPKDRVVGPFISGLSMAKSK